MHPSDTTSKPLALPPAPAVGESALVHSSFQVPLLPGAPDAGPRLPPAMAGNPTLGGLMQALRRRWPLALLVASLTTVLAVLAIFTLVPAMYPAQIRILVSSRADPKVFGVGSDEPEFTVYKATMAGMIKSQMVLYAAMNQKTAAGKDVKDLEIVRENGIDWLEYALKTDFQLGPEILKVTLSTDNAEEGADLLNGIAKAFVEENFLRDNERRERRIKDFKDNLAKLESELNTQRAQLRSREKDAQVPEEILRKNQFQMVFQQQVKAAEVLTINRTEQIKAREQLRSMEERLKKIDVLPITDEKLDEAFKKDDRTKGILAEMTSVENEMIQLKTVGQPGFIETQLRNLELKKQNIRKRLADLKGQYRPEYEKSWRSKVADDLQGKIVEYQDLLESLQKQEPLLAAEVKNTEDAVKLLAPGSQVPLPIISLQTKITNLEASVGDVSRTIQKMVAEVVNPRVSILQEAVPAKSKDYSRQIKFAGAGGFAVFILALFGVAYLEFRSRKISGVEEVSHGLGFNIVGSLPPIPASLRKGAAGNGQAKDKELWQNQLTESVDAIRTMLMHASRSENLRVIMVTSASGGEGKTSVATQLAASLARAWRKTLLIDGDLRNPSAHKVFDVPQEPGFSELLRNEVSVGDAIKPTTLGRLWLMPAGHFDSHAVQALAQDSMRTLFEQLKQQYDFIIVDSCPVLPVADSLLLGQHVDGVLFTVLRDVSRVPAVYAAQQKISNLAIRTLGAVMIGAKSEMGNLGYASISSGAKA